MVKYLMLKRFHAQKELPSSHPILDHYILQSVENLMMDYRRNKKLKTHLLPLEEEPSDPSPYSEPLSNILQGEIFDALQRTVRQLRPHHREIIFLRYWK